MKRNLKSVLKEKLQPNELSSLIKSYDIIGDIAVIKVPEHLEPQSSTIAQAVIETHKHVRTVLRQVSAVSGEFRLRKLEWVMGVKKTKTVHKEYGCAFKVDLEKSYFSPRLSHERIRITGHVKPGEEVVNMFAGVGCYSIIIAKHSEAQKIHSIDVNPSAVGYMRENIRLNRVEARVIPLLGDAKEIVTRELQEVADRVLMPLPEKAYAYLDNALSALKSSGGHIHYYDFTHVGKGESPIEKVKARVSEKLRGLGVRFDVPLARVVRTTGPNWYQVVVDVEVLGA